MPGHVRTFHFLQRGEAGSGRQPNLRGVEPGKPSALRKFLHFVCVFCRDLGTGRLILSYSFEMLVLTSPLQNDFSRWPEPSVLLRGGVTNGAEGHAWARGSCPWRSGAGRCTAWLGASWPSARGRGAPRLSRALAFSSLRRPADGSVRLGHALGSVRALRSGRALGRG